jgi:hypothetical protein
MPKLLRMSHIFTLVILTGLATFVAISFYYIIFFHVSPLSRDQWDQYAPYFQHGLLNAALTPMSGVHRYVFPFLLFDIDMRCFGGDNHFLVLFGTALDLLILGLLGSSLIRDPSLSRAEKQAFLVLAITALLWLGNIAQLGWGFMSTQYYLAISSYLFAIFSAHQFCETRKTAWLVSCLASGIISTFSFGMGILAWPVLLLFAHTWRAPLRFNVLVMMCLLVCLALFLLLPGRDAIVGSLVFSPTNSLDFIFHLAGGPIYYLLRSYRLFDVGTLKSLASGASVIATTLGIFLLLRVILSRKQRSLFCWLCAALMLCGLGSAALVSLARNPFFLDVWVDRFQIWATLFWLGWLPLLYLELKKVRLPSLAGKIFLGCLCCFPLVALPSQLDMGSRLAEYKIRVQQALLSYQVGIPDKNAAEDALHWNWENKLENFFTVFNYLRTERKNIYSTTDDTTLLGKPLANLDIHNQTPILALQHIKTSTVTRDDLLDLSTLPAANTFAAFSAASPDDPVAYQLTALVTTQNRWTHALITNESGIVIGLGLAIHHSLLPRSNLKHIGNDYNLYAVVRNDHAGKVRIYFLDSNRIDTAGVSESFDPALTGN